MQSIADEMEVGVWKVREYLLSKGMNKKIVLSRKQVTHIRSNWETQTEEEMRIELGLNSRKPIQQYKKRNGLIKRDYSKDKYVEEVEPADGMFDVKQKGNWLM